MVGTAAFAAASLMAAFSPNAPMLILARAALGVAGATLMPSTLALISNMFAAPRERALAIGIWATMFALGMALGPLLGGFLLQRFWGALHFSSPCRSRRWCEAARACPSTAPPAPDAGRG